MSKDISTTNPTWMIHDHEDIRSLVEVLRAQNLPITVTITQPKASDELTARFHCAVRCIAKQVEWNGEKLSEEEWKRLLVAAHCGQRVVRSPYDPSRFVVLDERTSSMSGPQKHDLLESIYAWGVDNGVEFDE